MSFHGPCRPFSQLEKKRRKEKKTNVMYHVGPMQGTRMHVDLTSLPGRLSPAVVRHCTISVLPFDVIVSYKCQKDAFVGHKPVAESDPNGSTTFR